MRISPLVRIKRSGSGKPASVRRAVDKRTTKSQTAGSKIRAAGSGKRVPPYQEGVMKRTELKDFRVYEYVLQREHERSSNR